MKVGDQQICWSDRNHQSDTKLFFVRDISNGIATTNLQFYNNIAIDAERWLNLINMGHYLSYRYWMTLLFLRAVYNFYLSSNLDCNGGICWANNPSKTIPSKTDATLTCQSTDWVRNVKTDSLPYDSKPDPILSFGSLDSRRWIRDLASAERWAGYSIWKFMIFWNVRYSEAPLNGVDPTKIR